MCSLNQQHKQRMLRIQPVGVTGKLRAIISINNAVLLFIPTGVTAATLSDSGVYALSLPFAAPLPV